MVMGFVRGNFYRFKQLYYQGGELALADINRKGKLQPKNKINPNTKNIMVELALDNSVLE